MEEVNYSVGQLLEVINNKADLDGSNLDDTSFETFINSLVDAKLGNIDYIIESKLPTTEDPTWYRLYKSGWLEQGGQSLGLVNFLKPYRDTTYTVTASSNSVSGYEQVNNPTPTSITIGQSNNKSVFWIACGQSA